MSAPAQQLAAGDLVAERYRVERKLSQGGMGAVYVALHEGTGRRVALKVMHSHYVADARIRERFIQEAKLGAMIASPHIVEVFDAGIDVERGIPYLVMELLEGETVAARLARVGRGRGLAPSEAYAILGQLCDALAAAHARGIVHRDLKPENLFLVGAESAPPRVKVLDFGIAKMLAQPRSAQNVTTAIGTPLWMAPEQNATAELTPAADVWAVGLIAFRLLTGRYYWRGARGHELDMAMLYDELVRVELPPASVRARELGVGGDFPAALDGWFQMCVARDPALRFADGASLGAALRTSFAAVLEPMGARTVPSRSTVPPAPTQPLQGTPGVPMVRTQFGAPAVPAGIAPAARPRWWMAAVPAAVVLLALALAALLQSSQGSSDAGGAATSRSVVDAAGVVAAAPAFPALTMPDVAVPDLAPDAGKTLNAP